MSTRRKIFTDDRIVRMQQRSLKPSIILTVVLAVRVFLGPFAPEGFPLISFAGQVLVLAALVYMAATTRRHLAIAGTLGIVTLFVEFLEAFVTTVPCFEWIRTLLFASLLVYVFCLMIRDLFTASVVDATILLLAVNCYLLVGILWAFLYVLAEHATPGAAFVLAGDPTTPIWNQLYYFSFVTLTTLGYGDIQPVSPAARSLAISEAVCGVMFTGILVARLVGLYGNPTKD